MPLLPPLLNTLHHLPSSNKAEPVQQPTAAHNTKTLENKLAEIDTLSISEEKLTKKGSRGVADTVVKLMHAEDEQQAANLNPVEAYYLRILANETIRARDSLTEQRKINNLNELLVNISRRADGDTSALIPGMAKFTALVDKQLPQLRNADGSYAYASLGGAVWDTFKAGISLVSGDVEEAKEHWNSAKENYNESFVPNMVSGIAEYGMSALAGSYDAHQDYSSRSSSHYGSNAAQARETGRAISGSSDRNIADSVKSRLLHGTAYNLGYAGTTLHHTARDFINLGRELSDAPKSLPPSDSSRTLNMNRSDRDTYTWDYVDSYYSSPSSSNSQVNISSSDKEAMKRFYNDEAAKLLNLDDLSKSKILSEDFMIILGMKKEDKAFNEHIATLLEKAIRDSSRNDFINRTIDEGFPKTFNFKNNNNLLHLALEAGNKSLTDKLLESDLGVFNTLNQTTLSPAHTAVLLSRAELIQTLAEKGLDFNIAGKNGASPLLIGTFTDNHEAIDELLKLANLDKEKIDNMGNTALINSSIAKNSSTLEKLLNNGFSPNTTNHKGIAAIHVLAYNNDTASARTLINHPETDINLKQGNILPAIYIATGYDNEKIVEMLLDKEAKLNLESPDGKVKIDNPLIFTVAGSLISGGMGSEKVADLLLDRGFRLNEEELKDLKNIHDTIGAVNPLINKLLKAHGVEVNDSQALLNPTTENNSAITLKEKAGALSQRYGNLAPMMQLIETGSYDMLKYIAFIPQMGNETNSLVHAIAESGNLTAMREFLKAGADPNQQNKEGLTALHIAAQKGDIDMIKLLSTEAEDNGWKWASAKALDKELNTPLMLAAKAAKPDAVYELLLSGSPVSHKNLAGENALSLATDESTKKVLNDFFRRAGKF